VPSPRDRTPPRDVEQALLDEQMPMAERDKLAQQKPMKK
jgi:hypothetical protein